ncbi:MAG: hypothetical protein M3Q29_07125 [Chloroflexota bacterium]|nr:hypothetical protein [Chloroflexota bacterium]
MSPTSSGQLEAIWRGWGAVGQGRTTARRPLLDLRMDAQRVVGPEVWLLLMDAQNNPPLILSQL